MNIKGMIRAEFCQGGTYPIALRLRSGRLELVRPALKVIGSFGCEKWYYHDYIVDVLLCLDRLELGRLVVVPICRLGRESCKTLKKTAEKLWIEEGKSEHEVEAALGSLAV